MFMNIHMQRLITILLLLLSFACKKSAVSNNNTGNDVVVFAPQPVTKSVTKKVFVHLMPWFESKASGGGTWGIHWKMNTQNPDVTDASGQRQIASHYYPLTGPYASSDKNIIIYQLLLMKLSGIDGVFIDWPGTQNVNDYPANVRNTEKIVSLIDSVGLQFAIVYEDQNLKNGGSTNIIATAQKDMSYLQSNFFTKSNYLKIANAPVLLVFGPQAIFSGADWSNVFSVLPAPPAFFPLWFRSGDTGASTRGEFGWIAQDHLSTVNNFYNNSYTGIKIGTVYPGFNSFYQAGGWQGPTWIINANGVSTFTQTLDLALNNPSLQYLQIATWNDYGEGTMIEPTKEFGYGFLTVLQQKLGVAGVSQADLEGVYKMLTLRQTKADDDDVQKKLDQVYYYFISMQLSKAKELLGTL